ncbi:MAG TPA: YqiA/YcfP family alpha/beta fold hydrolase [Burkholderiaceae bacterium]|nr:YqiA/YcfP family alpha/beta fold hydrolase [Burkholderiaceae bacterium]
MTTHLLYLHGFRSSPQSFKARMLHAWLQQHTPDVTWWCPQLPPSPRQAWELMMAGTGDWPPRSMAVMGSSLGGFFATAVAEQRQCRAVVLNPAVQPARDLVRYVGEQTAYHDPSVHFEFKREYIDELRKLTPPRLAQPERYAAVIAKGDELLDWREMTQRYAGARIRLLEGSDHALSDFAQHLPFVLDFLQLQPPH